MVDVGRFFRAVYRIRRVEEEIALVYPTDKIKSPVHLSIGQEAISVGVCEALRPDDVVFGTYRGHATYLAKGGDLRKMIAELYGKATGCARGKGGSMHLVDAAAGMMGASAVVGTTSPHAVGYAWVEKQKGSGRLVASFFGDGAVDEGVWHESLNFAALKSVPVIFICENNGYSIHSRQLDRQLTANLAERAAAYGILAESLDGSDTLLVYEKVKAAADGLRAGEPGPRFFECSTYRWREHVGPNEDYQAGYRDRAELARWNERDDVKRLGDRLAGTERQRIIDEVEAEILDAFAFAESSPFPDDAELWTDMYAEQGQR